MERSTVNDISKKVFIAGPIEPLDDPLDCGLIPEGEIRLINSFNGYSADASPIKWGDCSPIDECDYMVLPPGWERLRGCCFEYGYAATKGIPVMTLEEFCKFARKTIPIMREL